MSDAGTGSAPAGWYQDGVTAGQERYWDGAQWTEQFRPIAPPPPPAAPESAMPAAPAAEPAAAAAPAPAYPDYPPAESAPTTAYPEYQPAAASPRAPGQGLGRGAIIGIIVGAAVVVVGIILILGFTVWGWAGGGGPSTAQQQAFISTVRGSADAVGYDASVYTDQQLIEAGKKICEVGRTVDPGNPMGAIGAMVELGMSMDPALLALAGSGLNELCPDVLERLNTLGEGLGSLQ